jgi:hypothetical protein
MFMKNIINIEVNKSKIQALSSEALSGKANELSSMIEALPQECLYREHAKDVLKRVNSLIYRNRRSAYVYPAGILNEILDKTKDLIDPTIDPSTRLKLAAEYDEYARKLKWYGGLSIFVGVMCLLAAVVCLALIAAGVLLLAYIYPVGIGIVNPDPAPMIGAISVMYCLGILTVWLVHEAIALFFGGSESRKLSQSLQGLMIKVKEDINSDYYAGMNCLAEGKIHQGLDHLSKVTDQYPCYQKAQVAIQSYKLGNSALETKPAQLNDLIERVKSLEKPARKKQPEKDQETQAVFVMG